MPADNARDATRETSPLADDFDEGMAPQPAPQSRGVRVLLAALVGIAILSLLGVAAVVFYAIEFGESTTTDPAGIAAVRQDIADLEVPEGFEAELAVTMKVLPWGRPVMTWVKYSDKQTDSALVVAQLGNDISPDTIGFFQRFMSQIEQSLKSHQAEHKRLTLLRSDTRNVESRSQTIACQRVWGQDPDSKTPMIRVNAVFHGRHGPAGVILYADSARYNEETVLKLFQSIRGGATRHGT